MKNNKDGREIIWKDARLSGPMSLDLKIIWIKSDINWLWFRDKKQNKTQFYFFLILQIFLHSVQIGNGGKQRENINSSSVQLVQQERVQFQQGCGWNDLFQNAEGKILNVS